VWNVADGKQVAQADAPQEVKAVTWLMSGKQLATAGGEPVIHVWELPAQAGEPMKPLKEITGHAGPVTCLEPILDGHQLLSASEDKTVKHWAIDQGNRLVKSMDASGPVSALAASPEGKYVAAASGNSVRLWKGDQRTVAVVADIKGDHRALAAEAEATRRTEFATREVAYWKTALEAATKAQPTRAEAVKKATEALKAAETAVKEKLAAVEKAPDEKAKTAAAEEAHKAETARGAAKVALTAAQDLLKQADQTLADAKVSSEKAAAAIQTTKAAAEQAHQAVVESAMPIRALAFAPNGLALATAGDSGAIQTWSAETGAGFDTYPGDIGAVDAVAYTQDGRLVSATAKKGAVVWRSGPVWTLARTIGTGDEKSPLVSRVLALDFSADGQWIATGGGAPSRNGEVKIWKASDGSLVREITPSHSDSVYGLDFSPDGKLLATASADKFVKIFDATTGKLVKALSGHTHYVLGVSWRADGRMLASCGADQSVKLWSYPDGAQIKSVAGFQKEVTTVRFVGLGNELLTASGDTKVRLLKEDGSTARDFGGSKGFILAAAITPDGQVVLGGGQDSILRIWNGPTGKTLFTLEPPAPEVAVKGAAAPTAPAKAK
jgi:WD40 repeat protein